MNSRRDVLLLLGALGAAMALKALLLAREAVPFNSDEAVVALMARHILQGEHPVFFYGQAYMGSLDAWLAAGMFRVVGESVLGVRIVQAGLYLFFQGTLWLLARRITADRRVPALAVWLAALPPVMVTTYTTLSLGGYGEMLVLGNLILLLGYEVILGRWTGSPWAWLLLGLVGGAAFWTLGMAGVYLLPVAVLGFYRLGLKPWKLYLLCATGFLAGSSPWWWANLAQGGASLDVLVKSSLPPSTILTNLTVFFFFGLPALLGWRAPSSPDFPPAPLFFASLVFSLGLAWFLVRSLRRSDGGVQAGQPEPARAGAKMLFILLLVVFTCVLIFSNYGIDLTGRYFLALWGLLALGMAAFISRVWDRRPILGVLLLAIPLGINTYQTWQVATSSAKFTDQFTPITIFDNSHDDELMAFLQKEGELRGYTNYWVSFRMAFLSKEEIIYTAKLPYKEDLYYNPANNRYPPYAEAVETSQRVAYITSQHPRLDALIRQRLAGLGVGFEEAQIGPFHIFYRLSHPVRPGEIGL